MVKNKEEFLRTLSTQLDAVLNAEGGPTQQDIAYLAGLDQSFVSRALNGKLTRITRRATRLAQIVSDIYASMLHSAAPIPAAVGTAVRHYFAAGGDATLLLAQLRILSQAVRPPRHAETQSLDEEQAAIQKMRGY